MWRWRRVAVARVFALVVRSRVKQLLLYSRVGKNRDTRRESPAGAGAGRTADHLSVFFSQKVLAVRKANDIYRPVMGSSLIGASIKRNQIFAYENTYLNSIRHDSFNQVHIEATQVLQEVYLYWNIRVKVGASNSV